MFWIILACSVSSPPSDTPAIDDSGSPSVDDGVPCPDGWTVSVTTDEISADSCSLIDADRQTWCREAGTFSVDLKTATGLGPIDCEVDASGTFTCAARSPGAHYEDLASAQGTINSDRLDGTWTFTSEWWNEVDGEFIENDCASSGTLVATAP